MQVHELGPTHRRGRVPDQHQPRTRLLGIHRDAPPDVLDDAGRRSEGRQNADGSAVVRRELVVEESLPEMKGVR